MQIKTRACDGSLIVVPEFKELPLRWPQFRWKIPCKMEQESHHSTLFVHIWILHVYIPDPELLLRTPSPRSKCRFVDLLVWSIHQSLQRTFIEWTPAGCSVIIYHHFSLLFQFFRGWVWFPHRSPSSSFPTPSTVHRRSWSACHSRSAFPASAQPWGGSAETQEKGGVSGRRCVSCICILSFFSHFFLRFVSYE